MIHGPAFMFLSEIWNGRGRDEVYCISVWALLCARRVWICPTGRFGILHLGCTEKHKMEMSESLVPLDPFCKSPLFSSGTGLKQFYVHGASHKNWWFIPWFKPSPLWECGERIGIGLTFRPLKKMLRKTSMGPNLTMLNFQVQACLPLWSPEMECGGTQSCWLVSWWGHNWTSRLGLLVKRIPLPTCGRGQVLTTLSPETFWGLGWQALASADPVGNRAQLREALTGEGKAQPKLPSPRQDTNVCM